MAGMAAAADTIASPAPSLSPELSEIVTDLMPKARGLAWTAARRAGPGRFDVDECISIVYTALAQAGAAWEGYCARHGYDPGRLEYFPPYALKRAQGALLDEMRKVDWLTRTARQRVRSIDPYLERGATTDEIAAGTGLPPAEVRAILADKFACPVGFDPQEHDVPRDDGAAAELAVQLRAVVARVAELRELGLVLALHFHQELPLPAVAAVLRADPEAVAAVHDQGVTFVRELLLHELKGEERPEASPDLLAACAALMASRPGEPQLVELHDTDVCHATESQRVVRRGRVLSARPTGDTGTGTDGGEVIRALEPGGERVVFAVSA